MPIDLRFLRVARMVRLLKVLRLQEFEKSLVEIGQGLKRRSELMLVAVTLMVLSIYASSAVLYQLEHPAQPHVFTSIPATFWWSIETLTTIGYGDMVPITTMGKMFTGLIAVFGIGVFALPMAIVTAVIIESGIDKPRSEVTNEAESDESKSG
jgi:voltage-gated potassium channel